jgi:hypothetical protein
MPIETPADRAVFFNPDEFGAAAVYAPPGGGPGTPCTLLIGAQDREVGTLRGRAIMQGRLASVRKDEIAAPARGGTFTIVASGEILTVIGDPQTDEADRLIWTFAVD